MTTYLIGCGVRRAMSATSRFVFSTVPWPSATSTPSRVTTIRLLMVIVRLVGSICS